MKFYLLTNKIMGKSGILKAVAVAAALVVSPAGAETSKQQEQIVCATKLACEALTYSIQAQIDELETKSNLTKDDKKLRYKLRKQLIAVENNKQANQEDLIATKDAEILTENNKQDKQKNTIADEVYKQKIEDDKQERLTQVEARLSSIEGSL